MGVDRDALVASFDELGLSLEGPEVSDLAVGLAEVYASILSVDEVANEFLAFVYASNLPNGTQPTVQLLNAFESKVLKDLEKKRQQQPTKSVSELVKTEPISDDDNEDSMIACYGLESTPVPKKKTERKSMEANSPFQKLETPSSRKYEKRTNRGQVELAFGLLNNENKKTNKVIEDVLKVVSNLPESYAYMFEPLRERAGVLDDRITALTEKLVKHNNLEEIMGDDVGLNGLDSVATSPSWYAGMIIKNDDDNNDNADKLSKSNVALLGSVETSGGAFCSLDLSMVKNEVDLFPGQVVLVKATNPTGKTLIAELVLSDAMPLLTPLAAQDGNDGNICSLVLASGPFTTSDNLSYAPLQDLFDYVAKNEADVVVLMGPFLDEQQVVNNQLGLQTTFNEVFNELVNTITKALLPRVSKLVLIPSGSRDVHHNFIYPCPPFSTNLKKDPKLMLLSDPCIIEINNMQLGFTCVDPLFHLSKEAMLNRSDRMSRMAKLLLAQQCFYPLYPPNEDVNVDFEKWEQYCQMQDQRPHVLVVPSDLQHFVRDVDGSVIINPGRLAKKESGGVFLKMDIANYNTSNEKDCVMNRIKGEVVRI